MDELIAYLSGSSVQTFSSHPVAPEFQAEIARGKMFGVLIVTGKGHNNSLSSTPLTASSPNPNPINQEGPGPTGPCPSPNGEELREKSGESEAASFFYLAGYSGQICGRSDWADFVPAVFDYLRPDGYFKREEAEIVKINQEIASLPRPQRWDERANAQDKPTVSKGRRDGETDEEYISRRQFENARLHRWKVCERARREEFEAKERQKAEKIDTLKALRRQKSDALQTWLFRNFVMKNARGEEKDLVEIAAMRNQSLPRPHRKRACRPNTPPSRSSDSGLTSPPSAGPGEAFPAGTGECCEPKLLQYAFSHGLKPVGMAMFWWGESPRQEVRHHLQCYPACNGKCKPLLGWMLQGMDVESNPLEQESRHTLEIVYEDEDICVVNKPEGMLATPGKSRRESVQSVMRQRYPDATGPLIVHRLDMATSGLMVIAKTIGVYKQLQQQFAGHEVKKRYVAILTHELPTKTGDISLPLRPDLDDRPRQVVDHILGKPCLTHYEVIGERRVTLYPRTGRTHQLRVHCAHRDGLDNPIMGDTLYGTSAGRLYLHAERLAFRHPRTGREVEFIKEAEF